MTIRLTTLLALVLACAVPAQAQPQVRLTPPSAATLPAACAIGDLATKTGDDAGLYVCTAPNTWTLVAGVGVPVGGTDTQVLFNDGGALGADAGLTFDKATQHLSLANGAMYVGGYPASVVLSIEGEAGQPSGNSVISVDAGTTRADTSDITAIFVGPSYLSGAGAVIDNYAIRIGDQTVGASNWAIKTGTGLVEFGDDAIVAGTVTATDFIVSGAGAVTVNSQPGVTVSGTSCTITAITGGIITGASCTP